MKRDPASARRLVLTTVIVAVLAALIGLAGARSASRVVMVERLAVVLRSTVPVDATAACRAGRPRSAALDGEIVYHFYDRQGLALSAGAPPIDAHLLRRLAGKGLTAGRFDMLAMESRALVRLPSAAGSCVFAEARWPARWASDTRASGPVLLAALVLVVAVVAVAFAALTNLLVVRPLVRQLDEKGRALEWVLAELTHDIRTPLSSVQFALDEIAENAAERVLPALRRALSDVVYMRSLTSNLRLVERIQGASQEELGRTPFDLGVVALRVVARAQPFALRRGIELTHQVGVVREVSGDEVAVEQALTNLVENAIAHGEPGMRVCVSLNQKADGARIVVEDNGPGILPEELPRLGTRGLGDAVRARDGRASGLGLAITRAVCERSGWSIRFQRSEPHGLRVVIETA